ncbi:unnamed protein product [Peronospora destructor]|uniref:rRNA 2'-O-methyltransferase fibrillarin n=1 Tax=Peronospora destructor TaxID=86335 RepID=A0AAV0VBC6_9STRA|nr:unnamed protein product [Peronospora destructor]
MLSSSKELALSDASINEEVPPTFKVALPSGAMTTKGELAAYLLQGKKRTEECRNKELKTPKPNASTRPLASRCDGKKRISVDIPAASGEGTEKVEYRVWNPFRSKIAAAILGGVDSIWITPGAKVLYSGGASGTTVSHVSDIVRPTGAMYAVEFYS